MNYNILFKGYQAAFYELLSLLYSFNIYLVFLKKLNLISRLSLLLEWDNPINESFSIIVFQE
jgi:hypothetical protein